MDAPVRRFVFASGQRLDERYGQTAARRGQKVKAFSFQLFFAGGGLELADPDARSQFYREIERIRADLEASGELGSLDEPKEKYFYGRLAMFAVPFDQVNPTTLYMVGETELTYVALGGQLKDVVNRDSDFAKAAEGAPHIHHEREVARAVAAAFLGGERPARWEVDVVRAHEHFGHYPDRFRKKDYEILALVDEFTPASELNESVRTAKAVLLGKPLFVADA